MLNDALAKKVRVRENGKERMVTMLELIIGRLVTDAAKGAAASIKLLLALVERYGGTSETAIDMDALVAEDRAILKEYLAGVEQSAG
jgi:hypothetical protein